jgi:hypothetical protein
MVTFDFPAVATLSRHILRSDDSVATDVLVAQSINFMGYCVKLYVDDGDASHRYIRRRGAGGEPLTRRLREVMYNALPCELPELAVPAPGAEFVAIVL